MEPVVLERQQQCAYGPVDEPEGAKDPVDELLTGALVAVQLAERGDFPRLLVALALRPRLARAVDGLGMTALHWACSDPTAPARVLATVARAHPAAAATRNLAGLLPMHLAIRKRLPLAALQAVIQAYPRAVSVPTPEGYTALGLANTLQPTASSDVLALLRVLEAHARTGTPELTSSQWQLQPEDDELAGPVTDQLGTTHSIHEERALLSTSVSMPPPRWAMSTRCRLCAAKFGYFRQRHHCRNCGSSVCGRHSRHRVPLKHLGSFDAKPQRVCAVCFDDLQQEHNARAIARVATIGDANGLQLQLQIAEPSPVHPRYRRRSKSVYSEPPPQEPMPFHLDNNASIVSGEIGAETFPAPGRRRNWSATTTSASFAASGPTLQPETGSMFIQRGRPKQPTVLERQRQLRQQLEQCPDPQESRGSSRRRRPRPHSSALDKALHVQRLSEADSGRSSDEQELEQRMQRLVAAKHELGEAMRRSERELRRAESEKRELDAVANKYRASGYSSPQEDEDEDEEAENAATEAFLRSSKRLDADLVDREPPLDVAATHHELGITLLSKGDYANAVTELQRSVELDDEDARAWLHLAKALDGVGEDREAAEEAVRRALELEPHSLAALSLLGKLLHVRGDHDDAIHVFRHALELQCSRAKGAGATEEEDDPTSATM